MISSVVDLPAPLGPSKTEYLALVDIKGNMIDGPEITIIFDQVADRYDRFGILSFTMNRYERPVILSSSSIILYTNE